MREILALIDLRWGWWIAAVILAAAELVIPGVFLIWLALAAFLTGIVALLIAPPLAVDFAIFAIAAIAAIYGGGFIYRRAEHAADPLLNKRAARTVGMRVTICEAVTSGSGRATDGDSFWAVRGPDMPLDTNAKVIAMDGNILIVEPAD